MDIGIALANLLSLLNNIFIGISNALGDNLTADSIELTIIPTYILELMRTITSGIWYLFHANQIDDWSFKEFLPNLFSGNIISEFVAMIITITLLIISVVVVIFIVKEAFKMVRSIIADYSIYNHRKGRR